MVKSQQFAYLRMILCRYHYFVVRSLQLLISVWFFNKYFIVRDSKMESLWESWGYFRDKKKKFQKAKIHVCSEHICEILPNTQIQLNSRFETKNVLYIYIYIYIYLSKMLNQILFAAPSLSFLSFLFTSASALSFFVCLFWPGNRRIAWWCL